MCLETLQLLDVELSAIDASLDSTVYNEHQCLCWLRMKL